jgi:hypothetical protein
LADELAEELRACVAIWDGAGGENFVGELGAGFEGELFRKDERVIAVEEEGGDLLSC